MNSTVSNSRLHLALTRGVLAQLPLLYTQGQNVLHRHYGACTVLKAKGPDMRLIEAAVVTSASAQADVVQYWVAIDELTPLIDVTEADEIAHLQSHAMAATDMTANDL